MSRVHFTKVGVLFFATVVSLSGCGSDAPSCNNPSAVCPANNGAIGATIAGPTFGRLFGECYSDRDCAGLGAGAFCRGNAQGYLRGSCTIPCIDRTECQTGNTHHLCASQGETSRFLGLATSTNRDAGVATGNVCQQYCQQASDCGRTGYTCVITNQAEVSAQRAEAIGTCKPICNADADCGPGSECDEAQGACVAVSASRTTGEPIGSACASANACRSNDCIPQQTNGSWTSGYCRRACLIPAGYVSGRQFFTGDDLPNGGCPDDNVCFPNGSDYAGALGHCLKQCNSATDCRRPGYVCTKRIDTDGRGTLSPAFATGVCLPG